MLSCSSLIWLKVSIIRPEMMAVEMRLMINTYMKLKAIKFVGTSSPNPGEFTHPTSKCA